MRCCVDHPALGVLEDLVELGEVHPVSIMDKMLHQQACLTCPIDNAGCLLNHPLAVGLETAGRTEDPARSDLYECENKSLPHADGSPDHLAEEIDLPERVDMGLEKLIPSARATLGTWLDVLFLEDVLDGRSPKKLDPQFLEFSEYPNLPPAGFFGQANNDLRDGLGNKRPAYFLGLLSQSLLADPALVRSGMDDGNQLMGTRTKISTELKQTFFLIRPEKVSLLRNALARHDDLSFEHFNLPAQFVFSTPGKIKQKRRKPTCYWNNLGADHRQCESIT